MFQNYTQLLLAVTLLFCLNGFSQTNLVPNGDLENWTGNQLDDWVLQEGDVSEEITETTSGNSSVLLVETRNTTEPTIVSKNFLFEAGKTYRLSYDFKVKTGRSTFGQQVVGFKFGPVSSFPYSSGNAIPQGFDWESRNEEITINVTEEWKLEISAFTFADELFEVYIDNVSVIDINASTSDRDALVALYNATDGDNWTNSWDLNADISTWSGVTVNTIGRVTALELEFRNSTGSLPPEIGDLTELEVLDLSSNKLSGPFPTEIWNLTKLKTLDLSNNLDFAETIPSAIQNLSALEVLNLEDLGLIGSIPQEIGNLSALQELNLGFNNFSGSFPLQVTNLGQLLKLYLAGNNLTGNIPPEIGNLAQLKELLIQKNSFTGAIPKEIGGLAQLERLVLNTNNLSGVIPLETGKLSNLTQLAFSENDISGSIPIEITNLSNLKNFNAELCNLSGTIPQEIENLINLEYFSAIGNNLSGSIPTSVGNLLNLNTLWLTGNNLTGTIPSSIGNLTNLTSLNLSGNELTGNIPPSMGNLTSAVRISLTFNNLSGAIPSSFGNLSSIETLDLSSNNLNGTIPSVLGNLPNLRFFRVPTNNFSGAIPSFISPNILEVNLQSNNFVFEQIENLLSSTINSSIYNYNSQKNIDNTASVTLNSGDTFTISVDATNSSNNIYEWRKNGSVITSATDRVLNITDVSSTDSAVYSCAISNSVVSNLTIQKNLITLVVDILDADSDGVQDNDDSCSNTPSGESVDTNGCSQSQLDDDNDGVTNNNDNCPNTPTGETVNANGCSESQLDDDNDSVTNNNDTCPNTPSGESVDTNGCSESQLDDDNDGVTNNNDTCPNTPSGLTVDAEGCAANQTSLPNIQSNGIQVKITSTSCPNSANGEITVNFDQDYSYTVQITANLLGNTFDNVSSTTGLVRSDLPADTYSVCITIPEFPSFEQCFTVVIETPEDFESAKTSVDLTRKMGNVVVSGSKNYEVLVNDTKMNFSFEDTRRHELEFKLQDGANNILVKTDKSCQGEFAETVMLNSIRVFPNPTTEIVTILGLKNSEDATISISDLSGVLIKSYSENISNSSAAINVEELSEGLYLVRVKSNEQDVQTKIVKK